jgi:hypothetical protein
LRRSKGVPNVHSEYALLANVESSDVESGLLGTTVALAK